MILQGNIPLLQGETLRLREVKPFAQGLTCQQVVDLGFAPEQSDSETWLLTSTHALHIFL